MFCETHTETCCVKWQGLCGCNPVISIYEDQEETSERDPQLITSDET
jgi:hypothetical protein